MPAPRRAVDAALSHAATSKRPVAFEEKRSAAFDARPAAGFAGVHVRPMAPAERQKQRARETAATGPPVPLATTRVLSAADMGETYRMPLALLSETQRCEVTELCTVRDRSNTAYRAGASGGVLFHAHSVRDGFMSVPRSLGFALWGAPGSIQTRIGRHLQPRASAHSGPLFVGRLSEVQEAAAVAVRAAYRARVIKTDPARRGAPGGVVGLPCGYGKTTLAIALVCEFDRAALIIVRNTDLMRQWQERFAQFAPRLRVGVLQRGIAEMHCDVVVCMMQTLATRDFAPGFFDAFGFVIVDEAHEACTRTGFAALSKLRPSFTLGLTATLRRYDQNIHVLHWLLGPLLYRKERPKDQLVLCNVLTYSQGDLREVRYGDRLMVPIMVNRLVEDAARNYTIVRHLLRELQRPRPLPIPRKIIVFSARRAHLSALRDELARQLLSQPNAQAATEDPQATNQTDRARIEGANVVAEREQIKGAKVAVEHQQTKGAKVAAENGGAVEERPNRYVAGGVSMGLYIGDMSDEEYANARECQVIFSTYSMASQGFDLPALDTAFLTTPRGDVEQTVGRILRIYAGKNVPLVYYFADPCAPFAGIGHKVRYWCKNQGFRVSVGDAAGRSPRDPPAAVDALMSHDRRKAERA